MPTSNFPPIRLFDPGYWYKFTYLMTNSADPDQLSSSESPFFMLVLGTLSMLGKNSADKISKYFSYFSQKAGFDISYKWSSCMKNQSMLDKIFSRCLIEIFFLFFQKVGFEIPWKLSKPCFLGKLWKKKNPIVMFWVSNYHFDELTYMLVFLISPSMAFSFLALYYSWEIR